MIKKIAIAVSLIVVPLKTYAWQPCMAFCDEGCSGVAIAGYDKAISTIISTLNNSYGVLNASFDGTSASVYDFQYGTANTLMTSHRLILSSLSASAIRIEESNIATSVALSELSDVKLSTKKQLLTSLATNSNAYQTGTWFEDIAPPLNITEIVNSSKSIEDLTRANMQLQHDIGLLAATAQIDSNNFKEVIGKMEALRDDKSIATFIASEGSMKPGDTFEDMKKLAAYITVSDKSHNPSTNAVNTLLSSNFNTLIIDQLEGAEISSIDGQIVSVSNNRLMEYLTLQPLLDSGYHETVKHSFSSGLQRQQIVQNQIELYLLYRLLTLRKARNRALAIKLVREK